MTASEALALIKRRRPETCPIPAFVEVLESLQRQCLPATEATKRKNLVGPALPPKRRQVIGPQPPASQSSLTVDRDAPVLKSKDAAKDSPS